MVASTPISSDTGTITSTVLQNIVVLSAGQILQPESRGQAINTPVVTLLVTPEQAETLTLAGNEGRKAVPARCVVGRDHLLRRKVRAADKADLALPHELVERAQRLLDRRLLVGPVQLIEVDPIGAQPLQARLDRMHYVARRRTSQLACVIHRHL